VAHVVLSLEIGGMETVIANMARNIDRDLYRLLIICVVTIGPIGYELRNKGIKVIELPQMPRIISFLYPKALIDILMAEKVDILHCHSGCWYKAAIAGRLARAKGIIYTEHGRHVPDSKVTIILDKIISKITDYVVPVSEDLSKYLKKVVKIEPRKIHEINNGIDTDYFSPREKGKRLLKELCIPDNTLIIGNIARLAPVKDHITLINAFALTEKHCHDMRLLIIGDGSERANLEKLINELNLSDKIALLGFRRDIKEILSLFDLFVLSSISEGTSITILEAMASGKPVIATDVGANSDIITESVSGFLVPAKNAKVMAEKIAFFYKNRSFGKGIGQKGRENVIRNFSVQEMTRKYEKLYHELFYYRA
jgi:sugar transferase (PEP-CTERM/EpsH1 system associated)